MGTIYKIHHPVFPLTFLWPRRRLSEKVLTQLIQAGRIGAVQLPSGEVLVAADNNGQGCKTKTEIIATNFAHLRGHPISTSEAGAFGAGFSLPKKFDIFC
jgi:hypothetical protein